MAYCFIASSLTLLLFLLGEVVVEGRAQDDSLLSVTRHGNGDEYLVYSNRVCEERRCPNNYTKLFENCLSNIALRDQFCVNSSGQFFLGIDENIEPSLLVTFGSSRTLKVFNQQDGRYEDGIIVEKIDVLNRIEKQAEQTGCNITRLLLISTIHNNVTEVNHGGFNIILVNIHVAIEVDEESLYYPRKFYEGNIFQLNLNCQSNPRIDCIVFKFNGTAKINEDDRCFMTTPSQTISQVSNNITTTDETTSGSTNFWEDPTIQYIMIGSGCGIALLICIITILCIGICTLSVKSKNTALTHARRMEVRYNGAQEFINEDDIEMNQNSSYETVK